MNERAPTYDRGTGLRGPLTAAVVAASLAFAPGGLQAQEPPGAGEEEAVQRLQEQYGADAAESVRELVESVRKQGVPDGPLWDKALEGASKNVPENRFLAGVRGYGDRLVDASRTLPGPADAGTVVAAADALQRGVPESALRDVAAQASGRESARAAIPMVVLGDLVSSGVPVDRARSVVQSALQRGQGPRDMLVTSWAVRDLIGKGRSPESAARDVGRAVGRGEPPTSIPGVGSPPADVPRPGGAPVPPGAGPPEGKGPPGDKGGPGDGPGGSGGSGG